MHFLHLIFLIFYCLVLFLLQAQGGGLAFIHTGSNSEEEASTSDEGSFELLAYMNGAHEYVLFDPSGKQVSISNISLRERPIHSKETG